MNYVNHKFVLFVLHKHYHISQNILKDK